ncbi:hypothetical protein AB4Y36_22220 [Paraburkholderia sp. BR10936]
MTTVFQAVFDHKDLLLMLAFLLSNAQVVFAETFGNGTAAFYAGLEKSE